MRQKVVERVAPSSVLNKKIMMSHTYGMRERAAHHKLLQPVGVSQSLIWVVWENREEPEEWRHECWGNSES